LSIRCARVLILVSYFYSPPPTTTDPIQISELLARTIGDAHSRTCLFSGEHIADMLRKPQDISKVQYYKNMVSPLHRVSPTKFDALDGQTDRGIVFFVNYLHKKIFLLK
jgi:hypothetical protein